MNAICSFLYSWLTGAETQPEPDDLPNMVKEAMNRISTNAGLLGQTPINFDTLKGNPEVYRQFLHEMDGSLISTDAQVVEKCDMLWLKERLREFPVFNKLVRRKRQHMLKPVLNIINSDQLEFHIRFDLDHTFVGELIGVINTTHARLKRSCIYLRGGSILNPRDCFQSTTASPSLMAIPLSSFITSKYLKHYLTSQWMSSLMKIWHVFASIPLTLAIRALKRAEKEGLLLVCKVDENFTSKVCYLCCEQSNECKKIVDGFSGREISLWGVLQCQLCKHNRVRDKNACTNILYLGHFERNGDPRPEVFTRSMPYTPLSSPLPESSVESMDLDSDDSMDFDPDALPEQQLTTGIASLNL